MLIKSLRIISVIEGLSLLYLLFCSTYLKRIKGDAHAIEVPGMTHGVLFVVFCLFLFLCLITEKVSIKNSTLFFIASIFPFGFIWIERKIHKGSLSKSD